MSHDILVYIGITGLILGMLFFFIFLIRRISANYKKLSQVKKRKSKGALKSFRNLIFIFLWITGFALILYIGLFIRSYFTFTSEKPVAKIIIDPLRYEGTSLVKLTEFDISDTLLSRQFVIHGDQWMIEGDILKWDPWLNFFGLETRYRLTRIQGRHIITRDEIEKQKSIYTLVEDENHPLWNYFYKHYDELPFVDAVYGNAVFQNSDEKDTFYVYVSTSGFTTKRVDQ